MKWTANTLRTFTGLTFMIERVGASFDAGMDVSPRGLFARFKFCCE